jgi:hypothetical protein
MAILTLQKATIAGTTYATVAASAGGDQVPVGLDNALLVTNGSGASITVTIIVPGNTPYGLANPDPTVSVPASQSRLIGPFPSDLANANSCVDITYSGVTSLTVAAIQI